MMSVRKHLYPSNWKQLSRECKERANWRCERCKVKQGAQRKSKRTGKWYRVWLHAAHVQLNDTHNPTPFLMCLCPRCHGRYDFWLRVRFAVVVLEMHKHQALLQQREERAC
jgi:hypothetical protein